MHEVDLKRFNLRSDLIIENNIEGLKQEEYIKNGVTVNKYNLEKNNLLNKKSGCYITITFNDITDKDNYKFVLDILNQEIKYMLEKLKIKKEDKCLIIGLGNYKSTADSLGHEVIKNIIVTRHLEKINSLDKNYRVVSILEPNVIGNTGINSWEVIESVIKKIKPNFIITIDSLAARSINRIEHTIQITDVGIEPGSGIGNNQKELSFDTLKIPVLAIGVPTVVSSSVIVNDTLEYLVKKIGYHKNNYLKDKLVSKYSLNYLKEKNNLSNQEKKDLLGLVGTLEEEELQELIYEVLTPIGYNYIVSTKEIDFIIEKFGKIIADSLNSILHEKIT